MSNFVYSQSPFRVIAIDDSKVWGILQAVQDAHCKFGLTQGKSYLDKKNSLRGVITSQRGLIIIFEGVIKLATGLLAMDPDIFLRNSFLWIISHPVGLLEYY